jgi:tetratricopeptide (TPR) repeat protein
MWGATGMRSVVDGGDRLFPTARLMFWFFVLVILLAATAVADRPADYKPAPIAVSERNKLLADRDRFEQQSNELFVQRKYSEARATVEKVLLLTGQLFGGSSPEAADALGLVARIDERRGDWAAAQKAREEVLAIRTKLFGADHWQTGNARRALDLTATARQLGPVQRSRLWEADEKADAATQMERLRKIRDALVLTQESVEARIAALGSRHWRVADALHQRARLHLMIGDWSGAVADVEETLAIRRKTLGEKHPDVAKSLIGRGNVQWRRGDYPSARMSMEEGLAIFRSAYAKDHIDTATCLMNLGLVAVCLGDYASAREGYEEALAIFRRILPAIHPLTAQCLNGIGILQTQLGDYAGARKSHDQALLIRRKSLPKDAPEIAESLHNVGVVQIHASDYASARKSFEESLAIRRKVLRPFDPDIARSLVNLGTVNGRLGDYESARKSLEEALTIFHRSLPAAHPDLATTLDSLGMMHKGARDLASARKSFEQALSIRRRILPPEHLDLATSLANLGDLQRTARDYASARTSFAESLAIRRKNLPHDHPDVALSLHDLGVVQRELGDYEEARKSLEDALAIRRKILRPFDPDIARSLAVLGIVDEHMGAHDSAQAKLGEALTIFRKSLSENHPDVAATLESLGSMYARLRDYTSAQKSFEQALAIRRTALSQDNLEIAAMLISLSNVQRNARDYASARESLAKALAIRKRILSKDHPDVADCLHDLGVIQEDLGDYISAKRNIQEALSIRRKVQPRDDLVVATMLMGLGDLHVNLYEFASAKKSFADALSLRRRLLPRDDPQLAGCLNDLGVLQHDLGDFSSSRKNEEEALAILRRSASKDYAQVTATLINLGVNHRELHDYAAARKRFEEALTIARQVLSKDHPRIALSLFQLGRLSLETGLETQKEVDGLAEATDLYLKEQLLQAVSQAEREQFAVAAQSHWSLNLLLSAALSVHADSGTVYDRALRVKGGVTAQQRWAREARNIADPETKRLLERLQQVNAQLINLPVANTRVASPQGPQELTALIASLSSERGELERQLTDHSQAYRRFQAKARVDGRQIRALLPAATALIDVIEYNRLGLPAPGQREPSYERRLVAFIVRPDREKAELVALGTSASLARQIEDWRTTYGASGLSGPNDVDPGSGLRENLWKPLEEHLHGVKVVLVSPDGSLNGLPWAALPGDEAGHHLIDKYAFAIIPVPQLLPELLSNSAIGAGEPALLAAGNIDFQAHLDPQATTGIVNHFPDLPGTAAEVAAVQKIFHAAFPDRPRALLTGKDATKEAFMRHAPNCSCLAVCTHGFFLSDPGENRPNTRSRSRALDGLFADRELAMANPALRCGLVFAGANWSTLGHGNAFLTALEASELDLRRVDLAVLSACETGRGQVTGGEGVLGLQRAFQLAGARTCVTSLWKVDDAATQALMKEFYANLWQRKLGKLEALRQAQLVMLTRYDVNGKKFRGLDLPQSSAPASQRGSLFCWAGFVLSGDWR